MVPHFEEDDRTGESRRRSTPSRGTNLQMEITIEAIRLKANVKVATLPFFNPPRKTATPV